jgi:tRNA uridine 5-carboxymethylaminomethyl modification enzyme
MLGEYDVIVVGGGHAGCEAALAAATMGSKVLLVTFNMAAFAQMSCNPAMGGVAKGQVVREIDALGGYSGIVSDKSAIQFRMLNRSKGPAMWSPRTQNDRQLFSVTWRHYLEQNKNLDFWQDVVVGLMIKNDTVCGVVTKMGQQIKSKTVILTNGTFLNGIIHIGETSFEGGRIGDFSSKGITPQLIEIGFEHGRMKTGTPVRVDGRSVDFSQMEEQKGDDQPGKFSFSKETESLTRQRSCFITYTSPEVHDILKTGFSKSPLFASRIKGVGPRYCPSIEDKIERFSDRERHQLFIEPEGWNTVEYYVNGFSSSLPDHIQLEALRKVKGMENVKIFRPGYAIEYDYFPPTQLRHSLESKRIENLFFAGQINGTTGYEEAAAQGLMAGINAHRKINNQTAFILLRDEAYIGVMIDDLVTKGTEEPYRLFTSRAEYRVMLRQDNADIRLTAKGYEIGLASEKRLKALQEKSKSIDKIIHFLSVHNAELNDINALLHENESKQVTQKCKLKTLLLRPEVNIEDMRKHIKQLDSFLKEFSIEETEESQILIKYSSYITKEKELAEKITRLEKIKIPKDFSYHDLRALSNEAIEKLNKIKPQTIGQASRISGVSPADVSILLVHIGR